MQEKIKMEVKDLISILISIVAILITIGLFYLKDTENISLITVTIFVTIISVSIIGIIAAYILSRWENIIKKVEYNRKSLEEIGKSIKLKESYTDMEKRVSILEKLLELNNKKGQIKIDPRILYWILLATLLLIFAKSLGYF
jgi:hypothetical protein